MPLQKRTPALPRILLETLAAALCLFTIPVTLDWLNKAIHGQGGAGRTVVVLCFSVLGVILLLDVYRMMRQRTTPPTQHPDENTGSGVM